MGTLVRLGDTLYSFGATATFNDASYGAGWRRTDGQAWEAIQSTSEFFAGEVVAVTASDEALVASTITFGGPRGTPDTWRWTPATTWVRTSLSSDIIVDDLTWAGGTFLAGESSAVAAGGDQPSMWTSADGLEWTRGGIPDGLSDVCALTSMAGGFLAFGRAGDRIAAWTSADGARWVESEVELAGASGITDELFLPVACRVVAVDSGLVAVVLVANDTLMWTSLIWTSRDGVSWDFQESLDVSGRPLGAFYHRVPLAAVGRRVLLATSRSDPAEPDGSREVLLVGVVEP